MFSKKEEKKSEHQTQGETKEHPDRNQKEHVISEKEYQNLLAKSKELEELRDKMLRTAADYENAKKRAIREKEEFFKFANERLLREFLPVMDNLDRALEHAQTHKDSKESVLSGIELIRKQMHEMLKQQGVERQETIGKKFDPHQHEAIAEVEDTDVPEGTILGELEGGYMFQGRLLRPARVRIAKGGETSGVKNIEEKDPDIT
ncbi:MAG: nucleotide exchange factor GrpE [Candidatus Omnitrophica bacterium]|nr:nucleotide exchange factor GrpE [Candidatus Omnitrophota bacterium]